jgi:AcrR family transcriptional regulator
MQQTKIIVDAAERLIAQKGARFTTQELVKEAGVALQTFYRHFAGKDQLLLAVIEDIVTAQVVVYEQAAADAPDPVERLHRHVLGALSSIGHQDSEIGGARFITAEHWRLYQLFPEEVKHATRPFADLVARELRAARDAGLLDVSDVEADAELVSQLVMSVFHHYSFAKTERSAEAIGERVWGFCLAGLGGRVDGRGGASADTATRRVSL